MRQPFGQRNLERVEVVDSSGRRVLSLHARKRRTAVRRVVVVDRHRPAVIRSVEHAIRPGITAGKRNVVSTPRAIELNVGVAVRNLPENVHRTEADVRGELALEPGRHFLRQRLAQIRCRTGGTSATEVQKVGPVEIQLRLAGCVVAVPVEIAPAERRPAEGISVVRESKTRSDIDVVETETGFHDTLTIEIPGNTDPRHGAHPCCQILVRKRPAREHRRKIRTPAIRLLWKIRMLPFPPDAEIGRQSVAHAPAVLRVCCVYICPVPRLDRQIVNHDLAGVTRVKDQLIVALGGVDSAEAVALPINRVAEFQLVMPAEKAVGEKIEVAVDLVLSFGRVLREQPSITCHHIQEHPARETALKLALIDPARVLIVDGRLEWTETAATLLGLKLRGSLVHTD